MIKNDQIKKNRPNYQQSGKGAPWLIPLVGGLLLIGLAVAGAYYLVNRNSKEDEANKAASQALLSGKAVVTPEGWVKGNPAAKTVLVEFGDFQCGSCGASRLRVERVMKKYSTELKLVFKHFPLDTNHKNAMIAAQAAEAAGRQFKFWEMYDQLYTHQIEWFSVPDPMTFFIKYASAIQLDLNRFRQDVWATDLQEKIYRDKFEGQQLGVSAVPAFYLNGKLLPVAQNDDQFEAMIAEGIKKAP
jgi:protein-disulfide isomerase